MANILSAKKADRVSKRRNKVNALTAKAYKEARKAVVDAVNQGELKKAEKNMPVAYAKIDLAAKKKVLKPETAARYKSRLAMLVKKAGKK